MRKQKTDARNDLRETMTSLQEKVAKIEKRLARTELRAARESAKEGGALWLLFKKHFSRSKRRRQVLRLIDPSSGHEEITRASGINVNNVRRITSFLVREGLIERISEHKVARFSLTADGTQMFRLCAKIDDS